MHFLDCYRSTDLTYRAFRRIVHLLRYNESVLAGGDNSARNGDDAVHGPAVLPVHHLDALAAVVAAEDLVLALHQLAQVPPRDENTCDVQTES